MIEPDPDTFLPDALDDAMFAVPPDQLLEVRRRTLALGVAQVPLEDPRFVDAWVAVRDGGLPSRPQAAALRDLTAELEAACASAPKDLPAWERAELARGLVASLDTDRFAAAYEAAYAAHRLLEPDGDGAVLEAIRGSA